tara:strand:+ start:2064 stop:2762 length:699 start_codon:yes stop_codon:yes gene_type:complete
MIKKSCFLVIGVLLVFCIYGIVSCRNNGVNKKSNEIYSDKFTKGIPIIPGKIQCEYYNLGGEGIAYHDTDSVNSGSGALNKGKDYLSTFRIEEAVDISYTKFYNNGDSSEFNLVQPKKGQLYIGWSEPGEWMKYTVKVKTSGIYVIGIMYTANGNVQISLDADNGNTTGSMDILTTNNPNEPFDWRQWHHWNYLDSIGNIELQKGIQTLTLRNGVNCNINYDFLSFTLLENQ